LSRIVRVRACAGKPAQAVRSRPPASASRTKPGDFAHARKSTAYMRYHNRASHDQRNIQCVNNFRAFPANFGAAHDVVGDAVVASKYGRGNQAEQFLRVRRKRTRFVSLTASCRDGRCSEFLDSSRPEIFQNRRAYPPFYPPQNIFLYRRTRQRAMQESANETLNSRGAIMRKDPPQKPVHSKMFSSLRELASHRTVAKWWRLEGTKTESLRLEYLYSAVQTSTFKPR
jgi:hypothetical protein